MINSWRQHPTKQQLYGHLPPIMKTIKVRQTRHAGHCWKSRDELINDLLLWTPSHGWAKAGRPAHTYIQQLCEDMGCSPEDLPEAMNDREGWRERVRDIRVDGTTRWWLSSSSIVVRSIIKTPLKCLTKIKLKYLVNKYFALINLGIMVSLFVGKGTHINWESYVTATENVWFTQHSHFRGPQLPSDKLSQNKQILLR